MMSVSEKEAHIHLSTDKGKLMTNMRKMTQCIQVLIHQRSKKFAQLMYSQPQLRSPIPESFPLHELIKPKFSAGLWPLFQLTIMLTGLRASLALHNYKYALASSFLQWVALEMLDWS